MTNLILVRHGESEWNKLGLWTGLTDIGLSAKGIQESALVGEKLKTFTIDICYMSSLKRSGQTLDEIKKVLGRDFPTLENKSLNERDYGVYTGKNKWEIQKEVGEDKFQSIRRGWDSPIPEGETLKDVYNRVVPYYQQEILPKLKSGKNVLIVAHGNSLRALVKFLEGISDAEISNVELATGEIYVYDIDKDGNVISKEKMIVR